MKYAEPPRIEEIELQPVHAKGELVVDNWWQPEIAPEVIPFHRKYRLELVTIALPMAFASVYLLFIAAPRFVSESEFMVRTLGSSDMGNLATLLTDQKVALQELASLRDNLEHIKDTVAMQQSYAKLCGVTETVQVVDLVEDSLRLNAGAFVRHGVTLRREFAAVPPITVDKHKVLQILVNLVRNAKYACDESGRADKLLILRIEPAPAAVRICVIDNGVGIAPENMHRLFTHGFTTRASGHGFGLHSGALAAQELGGSLKVKSDGLGHGATFILELPSDSADGHRD